MTKLINILRTKQGRSISGSNSCKMSVKVYKTWFESQWTRYGKLTQSKSGQTPKEMTEYQNYIQDKLDS